MSRYVSILAGGSGTRLWPLSRSHQPKQLVPLLGDRSLVQATVDRVAPLIPHDHIVVVTEQSHADALREQLPELPSANVLVEPVRRGTAAAVGLAAQWIAHQDPRASMASLHADHAIRDPEEFRACLAATFTLAESAPWLVTLGIRPSSPHTGMGYIQPGEPLGTFGGKEAFRAARFVEKPDQATAERFLTEGYLWNPGYFIFQVQTILDAFAQLLPELQGPLSVIGSAFGSPGEAAILREQYPKLRVETIDYGIMERAEQLATMPADFGWSDIGSWAEVWEMSAQDAAGNAARGIHADLDSTNLLVLGSGKPVITLGLHDLTVVDLPDVLLICPRERAQDVKALVEQLQKDPRFKDLL
jgi:mannose-1-phosphate guanylyltransferase